MITPHAVVDRVARGRLRDEKALVENPGSRKLHARTVARFVACFGALVAWGFLELDDGWWQRGVRLVAAVLVGWLASTGATEPLMRAGAYRTGWLDGRMHMVASLGEASRRDMTLDEWLTAQYEHDVIVMGVPRHRGEDE